jgi:hypothetical protein
VVLGHINWRSINIRLHLHYSSFGCFGSSPRCRAHSAASLQNAGFSRTSNTPQRSYSTRQEHHLSQINCMVHCLLFMGTHPFPLEQLCSTCRKGKAGVCWVFARKLGHWSRMVGIYYAHCIDVHGFDINGEASQS